ncbi:phage tail tape measure protein [Pseudomonas guariconensis]|uniref:phage tail tape measure protein n=1 Tax=Pseudomonas guariconensis TaxID=1288410 RepID=UPI00300DBC2D
MAQESRLAVTIDSRGAKRNADDLTGSLQQMEKAGDSAAASAEGVSDSLSDQRKALSQLLGQINPSVAALGRLDEMQERLSRYKKAGIVESDTFVEYTNRINTMRDALGETTTSMNRAGMSAKAYQAALRGVPAQFTDIAVSLQGGQAPLTVFLQQGGQLKDMFGGAIPAARALGGYVLGLVNPFTVAAAAAATLGLAYYKGSESSDRLTDSIIKNGNAAGTSYNELAGLAEQVARTQSTVGAASEVLEQLSAAGNKLTPMYAQITRASLAWSKQTGADVSDVVKTFNDIAKSPVEAVKKLDAELNFLTATQYANIAALQEQGKTIDAAKVATEAYASTLTSRASEMESNLGSLESAWDSLASRAKWAWDAMLDVGRKKTPEQEIAEVYKEIADAQRSIAQNGVAASSLMGINPQSMASLQKRATELQRQIANASWKAWEGTSSRIVNDAGKKGVDFINSTFNSAQTQTEKLKKQLADLDKARTDAMKAGGFTAEEETKYATARKNIEKEIADIKEREAKKSAPRNANRGVAEAENTFSRLYAQYDPASQAARALTKEQQQLDLAFQKGKISQEEYGKALAQASTNYAAAIKGAQGLTQAEQYRAQMERQLATQRMEYAAQADAVGMGQKDAARMQERLRIEQDTNNRILQLQTELANAQGEKQRQDLQAQIDIEREFLQKRVAAQREGWSQIDQAQADWSNGARGAFQDYMDSARDVAGQTRNLFSNAFGNMEDAVVNFVKTGKLSFKDFADQVVADLIRIQVRQAAAGFLGSALGFLGGGGGAAAAGSGTMTGFSETISRSGFAAGGYTGDGGKFEPKGVVHGGEYVVRKEVVSQPGMRDHLDRLNRKGYASGGYVEPAAIATQSSSVLPANQTGLPPIVQHISVQGTADDATLARIQQAAQKGAQDGYNLVLRDLKTNGPARQLIARNR